MSQTAKVLVTGDVKQPVRLRIMSFWFFLFGGGSYRLSVDHAYRMSEWLRVPVAPVAD